MSPCITSNTQWVIRKSLKHTVLFAVLSAVSQDIPVDLEYFHKDPHEHLLHLHPLDILNLPVFQSKCTANVGLLFFLMKK